MADTFTPADNVKPRLTTDKGNKPVDLLITLSNLTADDAGAYVCLYKWMQRLDTVEEIGAGSVVLVVHDAECAESHTFALILVCVLSFVILLLIGVLMMGTIRRTKTMRVNASTKRPPPTNPSDVYEDMRSTPRR